MISDNDELCRRQIRSQSHSRHRALGTNHQSEQVARRIICHFCVFCSASQNCAAVPARSHRKMRIERQDRNELSPIRLSCQLITHGSHNLFITNPAERSTAVA